MLFQVLECAVSFGPFLQTFMLRDASIVRQEMLFTKTMSVQPRAKGFSFTPIVSAISSFGLDILRIEADLKL